MYPTSGRRRSRAKPRARPTLPASTTSPSYVPFPFFSLLSAMTSPRSPAHSRVSSGVAVDIHYSESPYGSPQYARRPSTSNASYRSQASHRSRASIGSQGGFSNGGLSDIGRRSPSTPGRGMSRADSMGFQADGVFSSGGPVNNDFGNLADELADAWNSDEEGEVDMNFQGAGGAIVDSDNDESRQKEMAKMARDSGVSVSGSPTRTGPTPKKKSALSPPKRRRRSGSEYEGSDYGTCSDADETGLPPALIERMGKIESLARRGSEDNCSSISNGIPRVIEGLKGISGQAGIEMGATRLITAHTAMSTHILYQTRSLQTLTFPFRGPHGVQPNEETIDEILPLLVDLSESQPRPDRPALEALAALKLATADLTLSLGGLADSLHESRQTTTLAARRLKVAKELVEDLRKEEEMRQEGHRHLLKGGWDEKLRNREASIECKDVLDGFEGFCEEYRSSLVALCEAQSVGIAA